MLHPVSSAHQLIICFKVHIKKMLAMECNCIAVERLLLQKDMPLPTREDHG
jgi:hypothetical protein